MQFEAEGGDKILLVVEYQGDRFGIAISTAATDEPHVLAFDLSQQAALSVWLAAVRRIADALVGGRRVSAVTLSHILQSLREEAQLHAEAA